jgi:hypothetical protein
MMPWHLILCQMTSTKPYIKKKAVLIMYKIFLKFPEALRPAFPRLKEKLEDPDSGKTFRYDESRYYCIWRRNVDVEMMCASCNRCAVSGSECHL